MRWIPGCTRACPWAVGNLDGPGEYWDNTKLMCTRGPYRSLIFLGDRGAAIYALHAACGPTLVFNGTADTVVAIPTHGEAFLRDLQRRVAELRGSSIGVFEIGFEPDASHRPFFVTRPVVLWLARNLGFPRWTEVDIQAMPETHISEWARAEGVAMDPMYATEDREGGTRALGTGIPGLSRKSLTVFSEEEWQSHKNELIFEKMGQGRRGPKFSAPPPRVERSLLRGSSAQTKARKLDLREFPVFCPRLGKP